MSEYAYQPSPWGEIYHNLQVNELLGAGSAGPGKTEVLLNDANPQIFIEHKRCNEAMDHPFPLRWGESQGWALHLRRTVPQLAQTIVRSHRIFPRIDPKARWLAQDNTWLFSSGYRYQFGHCKDPDDWENYYSSAYTWIGFDEAVQFLEEQYDQIRSRCRTVDPVLSQMLKVRLMSNPIIKRMKNEQFIVKDPLWLRRRFVDPAPEGKKILKKRIVLESGEVVWRTRMYLPARLSDNPNKEFVRQYEIELRDQKPHVRDALLYGNWYVTEGSFYADVFKERVHIIHPFRIPDSWPRFRSMDWGYNKPGCVHWYALDEDDNLYVFRELTFRGKTDVEVAMMILEIELGMGLVRERRSILSGPADDQIWEQRGEHNAKTKAQAFAEKGVYWVKADKGPYSRERNAGLLVKRLKGEANGMPAPRIYFFNTCKDILRTLPAIQTELDNVECPMDGGEDHWHDSICYGVAFASKGRRGMPKPVTERDDFPRRVVRENRGPSGYGA